MVQIKSTLNQITDKIKNIKDVNVMKSVVVDHLTTTNINNKDKNTMITVINNCYSSKMILQKVYNFILKYEGLGVI